jgi:hypothetical protein
LGKEKKVFAWCFTAALIMTFLLLLNYCFWGIAFAAIGLNEFVSYGLLTVLVGLASALIMGGEVAGVTALLAGVLRWLSIILISVYVDSVAELHEPFFFFELPIMVLSYYIAFKIVKAI